MQVKMLIVFDYNPETNEYIPISKEIVEEGENLVKAKKPTAVKQKNDGSTEPLLTLEDNKFVLNTKAVEALGVVWEDRITIKYVKQGNNLIPKIAKDEIFGTKGGNKLTKSNTVSCRGKANEILAAHGTTFKLIPTNVEGMFLLDGGMTVEAPIAKEDNKIKVLEGDSHEDLPLEAVLDAEGSTKIEEVFSFTLD